MQNYTVAVICSVMVIAGIYLLMYDIAKKHFKNLPFAVYMMLCQVLIYGCGSIYMIRIPDLYAVPIYTGLTLTVWGLFFWQRAILYDKDAVKSEPGMLFAGSVCMALVAGARPQMLLASFLAIPLFWNAVFKDRLLFGKKSVLNTLAFITPFVLFAEFMMYYNASRFGSPFDFGANYNLTTNDMTKRGFSFNRTGLGLFMYLLQPPVYTTKFPYINPVYFYTEYMGRTVYETMIGGVLATHLTALFAFSVFKMRSAFRQKGLLGIQLCLIAFGIIIPFADTQMSGILLRYFMDFNWAWLLAGALGVMVMIECAQEYKKFDFTKYVIGALLIACICEGIYDFAQFFADTGQNIRELNPHFYYSVKTAIEFWH